MEDSSQDFGQKMKGAAPDFFLCYRPFRVRWSVGGSTESNLWGHKWMGPV